MRKRSTVQIVRIFSLLFFSVSVWAQQAVEISDPRDELKWLNGISKRPAFSSAFRCGEPLPFFVRTGQCSIHCQFSMCEQMCDWPEIKEAQLQAEECTNDSLAVYSTLGHAIAFTAADYKASGNTVALSLIKAIPMFYQPVQKIEVDHIGMAREKKFIENGKMKSVIVTPITLLIYPDRTKSDAMMLQLNLDLSRSGLDQLMCFSEEELCMGIDRYFIKRKGLINGP